MPNLNWVKLDELILDSLKGSSGKRFSELLIDEVAKKCVSLSPATEAFRTLDRRLQVLRKAGSIAYFHKSGWYSLTAKK